VSPTVVSHAVCGVVYFALALLLTVRGEQPGRRLAWVLIAACSTTGLWAFSVAFGAELPGPSLARAAGSLDLLRLGLWLAFLALAYRTGGLPTHAPARTTQWLWAASGALLLVLVAGELAGGGLAFRTAEGRALFVGLFGRLVLTTAGLILVAELFRKSEGEYRWRIKYLCVGLGGLFAYELFFYSEALLLRRVDPTLDMSRGAVSAIVAPLLAVAAARNPTWSVELNVSRRAAFHSTVLIGVGLYVLALSGVGAALRVFGGDWGVLLQVGFLFAALVLLVVLMSSGTVRSVTKLRLSRYFFTHRHDYREQWRWFADALSASDGGGSLRQRALRAVARVVGSPGGGLWLRESDRFALAAELGLPEGAADLPADAPLGAELARRREYVVELDADRAKTQSGEPWLPEWLCHWRAAWLVLPLVHRDKLVGFIVLARSAAIRRLDREDEELLLLVARHIASYLVEEQTTRALVESRRFVELSRRTSFIAHDLRNLANELSLTLANTRKHIQNPEFQRDLLLNMEESVEGMRRLLDRLRPGNRPSASAPTDFARVIGHSLRGLVSSQPTVRLDLDPDTSLPVAGDQDLVTAMSGHLIRNAVEAAGSEGHVILRLRRDGGEAIFEVVDDGPGMTAEFVSERMHHPFGSSNHGGLGIGLYECRELARELGGRLEIDSEPGNGTTARLRLPLAKPLSKPAEATQP
jgi:putative PEP-CTERM system histidine kinase